MDLFGARNVCGIIVSLYTAVGFGTLLGPNLAACMLAPIRSLKAAA